MILGQGNNTLDIQLKAVVPPEVPPVSPQGAIIDASWDTSPDQFLPLEQHTITIIIKNTGASREDFRLYIQMDGHIVLGQQHWMDPGQSDTIEFATAFQFGQTHDFRVMLVTPEWVYMDQKVFEITVQNAPARVGGIVIDEAGTPIPNATISLAPSGGSPFATALTDADGRYEMIVTPQGIAMYYGVFASAPGYKNSEWQMFIPIVGGIVEKNITLVPI